MSFNVNHIRAMVENSTGFVGGNYYDNHPYMGLVECIQACSNDMQMLQLEFNESTRIQNEAIITSTFNSLTEGTSVDYEAINEASKEGLLDKIKKFFGRIRDWVSSIIAKLKNAFKKQNAVGKDLWDAYKDSEGVKNPKRDTKFTGYEMKEAVPLKTGKMDVNEFINAPSPSEYAKSPNKDLSSLVEGGGAKDRKAAIASKVSGITGLTPGDYVSEIHAKLFGEKKEMTYGTGMFTVDAIRDALTNTKVYDDLIAGYADMDKMLQNDEASMIATCQSIKQDLGNDRSSAQSNDIITYCSNYLTLYKEATDALNDVKGVAVKYQTTRVTQAGQMLKAIANAGGSNDVDRQKKYMDTNDQKNREKARNIEIARAGGRKVSEEFDPDLDLDFAF